MAVLTEKHLEKYASEVVDSFFQNSIPMTETVVKVAERENFNPEQIRRLVETANNMAFQRKFKEAEGPDRMDATEFQTADPNAAIQKLVAAAQNVMRTIEQTGRPSDIPSNDLTADLPTTRPEATPLDMAGPEDNLNQPAEPKIRGHVVIMRLRKTAEAFEEQKYQKRIELTDTFQKLATVFTKTDGPVFETFEKDALYKWGPRAAPHLQLLRQSLKKDPATYDPNVMRKVARIIDSSTPEMHLLATMMKCSENIVQLQQGLDRTNEYLKNAEKYAR